MPRKLKWGILSGGWMSADKMVPAILRSQYGEVAAISSRSLEDAQLLAACCGGAAAYQSIEELLADPNVEAVYNPLPTRLHVPVTLQAVAAGKHVLCEKPIALSAGEASQLRQLDPDGPRVMEAFMVRHHPQWALVKELCETGRLGTVRAIQSSFCYFNDDPNSGTNRAADGGGALLYVGCYPIVIGRFLWQCEPERVLAASVIDDRFGTDADTTAIVDFGKGRTLSFHVSTHSARNQSVRLIGEKGHLSVQIPYNTPETENVSISLDCSDDLTGASAEHIMVPAADHYAAEADAFALSVLEGLPVPYGIDDALANMAALDAAQLSAKEGRWVALKETRPS